jgi:hypothetical protein
MLRKIARLFGLQPIPKTGTAIVQQLEDFSGLPSVKVENFAAIWDGGLGFAWNVAPALRRDFAKRLRALARSVENCAD